MILDAKIKDLLLICLIFLLPISCATAQKSDGGFLCGADRPEQFLPKLKNKRIIVVTNATGLLKNKQHIVDFLLEKKLKLQE